jgi:hypothetical protein
LLPEVLLIWEWIMGMTAENVTEGLFAFIKANPWLMKIDRSQADMTLESAARNAWGMLCAGDVAGFRALPVRVQALAALLLRDYFAKLNLEPLASKVWDLPVPVLAQGATQAVAEAAFAAAALRVVWLEIEQDYRSGQLPH